VLEVTIRLGGAETISRHSVAEALHTPLVEGQHPTAIVVDVGGQTSADELDDLRALVKENLFPAVVILAERLAAERDRFASVGATVLVGPYRPSQLHAALVPGDKAEGDTALGDDAGGRGEPLIADARPAEE
jgi:hypothetical protein